MLENIGQEYTLADEIVEDIFEELKEVPIMKLFSIVRLQKGKLTETIGQLFPSMFSRSNSSRLADTIRREQLEAIDKDLRLKGHYFFTDFPRIQIDLGKLDEAKTSKIFENGFLYNVVEMLISKIKNYATNTKYTTINTLAAGDKLGTTATPEKTMQTMITNAKKNLKVKSTSITMTIGEAGFRQLQELLSVKITIAIGNLAGDGSIEYTPEVLAKYLRVKEILVVDDMIVNTSDLAEEIWGNMILFSKAIRKADGLAGLFNGTPSVILGFGGEMKVTNKGSETGTPNIITIEKAFYMGDMPFEKGFYSENLPFTNYVI